MRGRHGSRGGEGIRENNTHGLTCGPEPGVRLADVASLETAALTLGKTTPDTEALI